MESTKTLKLKRHRTHYVTWLADSRSATMRMSALVGTGEKTEEILDVVTVREYAAREGVTLGTVYRRIWEGQVAATQVYGRWLISPISEQSTDKDAEDTALKPVSA